MTPTDLKASLTFPVIAAPMLRVSSPDLLVSCCRSGIVGSIPMFNADAAAEFETMLVDIKRCLMGVTAPYAVNIIVRERDDEPFRQNLDVLLRHKPPIVISSVGHPGSLVTDVHRYGGLIFHDVATTRHAEKAIAADVDGLILLTHGAGGHTGQANPFAFVRNVRRVWNGLIALAGCISDGQGIAAAQMLGADFAYLGTRFAATEESWASERYRVLLMEQQMSDVIITDRVSGLNATFLRGSISEAGLDPNDLPPLRAPYKPNLPASARAWHNIWSAGHGVGMIDDISLTADLICRMKKEYLDTIGGTIGAE